MYFWNYSIARNRDHWPASADTSLPYLTLILWLIFYLFFFHFFNMAAFTGNLSGTEWPFMYWCTIKKLLSRSLTDVCLAVDSAGFVGEDCYTVWTYTRSCLRDSYSRVSDSSVVMIIIIRLKQFIGRCRISWDKNKGYHTNSWHVVFRLNCVIKAKSAVLLQSIGGVLISLSRPLSLLSKGWHMASAMPDLQGGAN